METDIGNPIEYNPILENVPEEKEEINENLSIYLEMLTSQRGSLHLQYFYLAFLWGKPCNQLFSGTLECATNVPIFPTFGGIK